jgi:ketosteroid isomerase-like protein
MKLFAACILMLGSVFAIAGQSKPNDRDRAVEQDVRNLVRAWDEADVKSDTTTLSRLLADEFTFVGGPNKAQYLDSFKTRDLQVESAVSTDVQVQVYGDAAVLTAVDTITGKNKGQSFVTKWLYLDVWVKRDGRWQCVKTYSAPAPN